MADYVWAPNHYVQNNLFLHALEEREKLVADAIANNKPIPQVSNYIAECIMKICTHLSYKPNFNGYTFKSEFVSDAIENCLRKVDKFSTKISNNPHFYFTMIAYNQFRRRILIEREQSLIKAKIVIQAPFDLFDLEEQDENVEYKNEFLSLCQENGIFNNIIEKEELRMSKKKSKLEAAKAPVPVVAGPLDMLFEDSE